MGFDIGGIFKDVMDVAEIVGSGGADVMAWANAIGDIANTVSEAEGQPQQGGMAGAGGLGGIMGDVGSLASIASMI